MLNVKVVAFCQTNIYCGEGYQDIVNLLFYLYHKKDSSRQSFQLVSQA